MPYTVSTKISDTVVFWLCLEKKELLSIKRKFNELCRNLVYKLHHTLVEAGVIILIRVKLEESHLIEFVADSVHLFLTKK